MIDSFDGEYRFLSNFYSSPVQYEGELYLTVEHAFQAAKTLLPSLRKDIQACSTPGKAKRMGRSLPLREDWEEIKLSVMKKLVSIKFALHVDLAKKLLATGNEILVEGNTWGDTFWGKVRGVGFNHLGLILMEVRENLKTWEPL